MATASSITSSAAALEGRSGAKPPSSRDEGGFAPDLPSNAAALEVIDEAVANAGYVLGDDITLALDCAASAFYRDGRYHLQGDGADYDSSGFADYLAALTADHPIV